MTFSKAEQECASDNNGHLAVMKTPWHNAFVTAMINTEMARNVFIGIHSQSDLGKHFIWIDGDALTYTQWRKLHPTHHELLNNAASTGVMLHRGYQPEQVAGSVLPATAVIYPGDWEDTDVGITNKMYSVCSVVAKPEWSSKGWHTKLFLYFFT